MTGTGILTIGIGCLMIALAILMMIGLISIAVHIVPKWFRKITDFLTGCFTERERRRLNEEVTKGMLIAAGIFGAVGIGLTTAGGVMGASMSELTGVESLKR